VVTEGFLTHFGLNSRDDLPGLDDLRAAGLLDARPAVSAYTEQAISASEDPDSSDESDEGTEEPEVEAEAESEQARPA
jgi:segregation and condensation protein B